MQLAPWTSFGLTQDPLVVLRRMMSREERKLWQAAVEVPSTIRCGVIVALKTLDINLHVQ